MKLLKKYSPVLISSIMMLFSTHSSAELSGLAKIRFIDETPSNGTTKLRDLQTAKIEFGYTQTHNNLFESALLFVYEENLTPFTLEQAEIRVDIAPLTQLQFGMSALPFGQFDTFMIAKPLTLELMESFETMVGINQITSKGELRAFTYIGDSQSSAVNQIEYGFGWKVPIGQMVSVDVGFNSNIADSNLIQEVDGGGGAGTVNRQIGAVDVVFEVQWKEYSLYLESMQTTRAFTSGDLGGAITQSKRLGVTHLEIARKLSDNHNVSVSLQQTKDAAFTGIPQTRYSLNYQRQLHERIYYTVELSQAEDYSIADGGSGIRSSGVAIELTTEF